MATMTKMRTTGEVSTGTWETLFPNATKSPVESLLFVKKLLAVAVSNIAYLRAVFPESAFGDRKLDDITLKILREDSQCPGAYQVIQWVKGCFDALDKQYLRMIIIALYADQQQGDSALETYSFRISYNKAAEVDIYRNSHKIASAKSVHELSIKKATIKLLRTIIVLTQTLDNLPNEVYMTMKLLYYDSVTPSSYEPNGFRSCQEFDFKFKDEAYLINVGRIETPHHDLQLRIKAPSNYFEESIRVSHDNIHPEQQLTSTEQDIIIPAGVPQLLQCKTETLSPIPYKNEQAPQNTNSKNSLFEAQTYNAEIFSTYTDNAHIMNNNNISPNSTTSYDTRNSETTTANYNNKNADIETKNIENKVSIRCPCGIENDGDNLLCCQICKFSQHALCFGISNKSDAPSNHVCEICATNNKTVTPTDTALLDIPLAQHKEHCLWRKCLKACSELKTIMQSTLTRRFHLSQMESSRLMSRLIREEYITPIGKTHQLGKYRPTSLLHLSGMIQYFNTSALEISIPASVEHKEIEMQRQIEESFSLQKNKTKSNGKRSRNLLQQNDIENCRKKSKASVASDPTGSY